MPGEQLVKFFNLNSISNKLALLIMFAVMPCLAILLYSGMEERQHFIETAESNVLLMTHSMAEAQKGFTQSTKQILSTLSQLPALQALDTDETNIILKAVLEHNSYFNNIALVDLNGDVLASGKPFIGTNLSDRKHVKVALEKNDFAVGEYIVTRVGTTNPSFSFAYPVQDKDGRLKAVLTAAIQLNVYSHFYDVSTLPEKSFVAVTDYTGVRIFYYPAQNTNPIGKPIQSAAWEFASEGQEEHGLYFGTGTDGLRRIYAYERVRLNDEESPYLYLWAGIPEDDILQPANAALIRNLLLMLLVTVLSLFISWIFGKNTLISPIQNLVALTRKFAKGDLNARLVLTSKTNEVGILTNAFHDMAETLTKSKRTLQESERRFRTVAEFAYDWEYWIDPDGNFIYLSPSCERITGYSPEEIMTDPQLVCKMVKPDYSEKVNNHYFDEGDENASAFSMEFPIIAKNGEEVWIDHNCRPVYDDQGNYAGRRGNNRDVTNRKRAEEEKFKLESQLRQSQKMESVGRLAGGVAHDFNNMLGVIIGYTELAMDTVAPGDPLRNSLQEILKASRRSADITRQLLAFARKQTIAPKVFDLNETIEGMLKMIRRFIGENIDLVWLPGADVWPVRMDPSQLDQIFANLCVNARDAITDVGKVTIETSNATFDESYYTDHVGFVPGDYVLLAVSDDGSGMTSETIDNLFEPFFTTKDVGKGTGLGLATVYGIVKQNNGFINVYSEPEKGTTFKIYLPRHETEMEEIRRNDLCEPDARGSETILLVEDEQAILSMTTIMLERLGYTVLGASIPSEAIRLVSEHSGEIHLLLTDVVMPEMNGRDLARNLQFLNPILKSLFMSGYTANVIAHHGVLDEGVCFIQKPFSRQDLALKVRGVLDKDTAHG